jgi:hypothetical protein
MPVVTISLRNFVAFAVGLAVAVIAMFTFQAWRADAAPGDLDTTFVPIAPCRLVDTRPAPDRVGQNGTFGPNDTRTIPVLGSNGNCTIPAEATGLSLNVTAIDATTSTFLTIWPDGARPLASSLDPSPGEPPTPNAVSTDLSDAGNFNIYNLTGNVNVIVDVNGYYTRASLTELATRENKLERRQPFALSTNMDGTSNVGHDVKIVMKLLVDSPPASGQLTVNSAIVANGANAIGTINFRCWISTDEVGALSGTRYTQEWQTPDPADNVTTLGGTRTFDVVAGETMHINLVCVQLLPGPGKLIETYGGVLTAVFTPN